MRIVDTQDEIYNPILKDTTKGFLNEKDYSYLRNNVEEVIISKQFEYRPDLMAYYYFGDPQKYWVINYINNFTNGIEDYIAGRTVLIPTE